MQPRGSQPPSGTKARATRKKKPAGALKRLWRRVRTPFVNSPFARDWAAGALARSLRLVHSANRLVEGSSDVKRVGDAHSPAVVALWHGQHLLAPFFYPFDRPVAALVSRSADAELNALVLEKLGVEPVRGSGGRPSRRNRDKGGARALLALKKALDDGKNVVMIADISKGKPRDAGLGIVMLGRISGRPILPMAVATSRRWVLRRTWDKTTINLPFGRSAVVLGDPIRVPPEADDAAMEQARLSLNAALDAATERAYALVDGRS